MAARASTSSIRSFSSSASTSASPSASLAPTHTRTRPLPQRKQVLFQHHVHLLTSSPAVLFLRPGHFSADEWRALRQGIAALPPSSPTSAEAGSGSSAEPAKPKLTLLRPGLLPALLRSEELAAGAKFDLSLLSDKSHLVGPLCALTLPELSPPTLHKLLALVNKASSTPAPGADPNTPKDDVPARLALLSSLVEQRALDPAGTARVSLLPGLDQLRAQIVGLLSQPAASLAGVLGARGRDLARTLMGLEEGLKPKEATPEGGKQA